MIDDYDLIDWHSDEPRDPRGVIAAIASALFVFAVVAGAAAKWGWW